jgi:hypothetical protein
LSSRLDDLRDLAQMLDEGKITQTEYEAIKTEILEAPAEDWAPAPSPAPEAAEQGAVAVVVEDAPDNEPGVPDSAASAQDWLTFAKEIPTLYWAAIGASVLTVFFAGSFQPLAWATAGLAIVALVKVKDRAMRWMGWTGLVVGVLFSVIALLNSGTAGTVDASSLPATSETPVILEEIPVGSLGIRFGDLAEGWNDLPDPPHILRGISTNPEPGPLDSFIYTFDSGAILAGAYNPTDQFVYALMAKVNLADADLSNFYVHLCYLLYPGTQECFDAYVDASGVFGKTVEELAETDHSASYVYDGNEWRVEILDDVLTLRVLGPQQTG